MEKLFWSIAFPGFGQLLNGKYIKGILFIILEFLINVKANFNEIIMLSFQGDIQTAINKTNYQWLMFYPCLYFFAMWDAYRDSRDKQSPYSFVPFVFSAYFVTMGVMFSSTPSLFGVLWGPVWLPILFLVPGITIGLLIKFLMTN